MADMVRRGETNAENLVEGALDLIEKTDNQLKAWAYIDAEGAIASAKLLDEIRDSGRALGPLHGVPIGLKDIIDTADMPTEFGSVAFKGHQPSQDVLDSIDLIRAVPVREPPNIVGHDAVQIGGHRALADADDGKGACRRRRA